MTNRFIAVLFLLFCLTVAARSQNPPSRDTAVVKEAVASRGAVASRDTVAARGIVAVKDTLAKEPFWKAWFGSVDANAGATAVFPMESSSLKNNRGLLFNTSALFSAWSDQDQLTVAAGGKNINESSVSYDGSGDPSDSDEGLTTSAQAGVNFFTTRLKGLESSAGLNYVFSNTETGTSSERNDFQDEEFMSTRSSTTGNKSTHSVTLDGLLKKDMGNMVFNVKPIFSFVNTRIIDGSDTRTMSGQIQEIPDEEWRHWQEEQERMREEEERWIQEELQHMSPEERQHWLEEMQHHQQNQQEYERMTRRGWAYYSNNSRGDNTERLNNFTSQVNADMTLRQLAGKKGRDLRFTLAAGYDIGGGTRNELSYLWTNNAYEDHQMHYDISSNAARLGGSVCYTEPIGDSWTVSALADVAWTHSSNTRNATDEGGVNERFSSLSDANAVNQQYDLTAQYKINTQSLVSLGARLSGLLNETFSKSKGVEETTGAGDWNWFVTPTAKYQYNKGMDKVAVTLSGYSKRPGTAQMLPVLDLRIPSRPGIGNIYLKPYSSSTLNASWTRNDKARASSLSVSLLGGLNFNQINYARWYDADKVQYAVPVNSKKPGFSTTLKANYSTPLDTEKAWTLLVGGSVAYNTSVSYQANGILAGLDRKSFDYTAFMDSFWGDAGGDLFYGGTSGFLESNTQTLAPSANVSVKFNRKSFNAHIGATTTGRVARYSLNPAINMNTLDTRLYAFGSYTTPHEFNIKSSFAYLFYAGYAEGFGLPECQWNAEVSKKIGDFTVSFKAYDILNQTRDLTHSVTANYEEDIYRLTMGRYFLLGLKWNFGKSDASHGQRARAAMKAMGL